MAGLQAQYAPSMYVGLWSRLAGFRREELTAALERRAVVQGTLLRSTIHLVSVRDYWPFALAVRASRRRWWLRNHPGEVAAEREAAAARLRPLLEERPLRAREIEATVGKTHALAMGLWLDLVRVPPSGTWERRRADLFAAAEDWLGPPPVALEQSSALVHVVRRYLAGFGPSTRRETAQWAGLPVAEVEAVLDRLRLRRFRSEDGEELLDVPGAPLPDAATRVPVRFLAVWDAMLLAHARRKGVLAEEHRSLVFNSKNPQSANTFLVDGVVAGTWSYGAGGVKIEPFAGLARSTIRELEDEAGRLAAFHA
jgi:hypothetical protein